MWDQAVTHATVPGRMASSTRQWPALADGSIRRALVCQWNLMADTGFYRKAGAESPLDTIGWLPAGSNPNHSCNNQLQGWCLSNGISK
jgi:hypothetical protein